MHDYLKLARGLAKKDRRLKACLEAGPPLDLGRAPGFASLLRIIIGQQVSVAAAASIWRKVEAALDSLAPETLLALEEDALRACGLSRQKIGYARGLAQALAIKTLDLDHVHGLDDAQAIAALRQIKGFGNWSAEMYLMFSLHRLDVWPVDDLGIVLGVQNLLGLPGKPSKAEMLAFGEPWRPHRSVAARMIWTHYNAHSAKLKK
ncbi:MAG: DNA-3-methyladenine glycosylase 2 family protein [Pseudomonadota bacterium]|nr:DNA-3-methyladenine glycosylase 2 family protein [Pseudomonadota bacterium]